MGTATTMLSSLLLLPVIQGVAHATESQAPSRGHGTQVPEQQGSEEYASEHQSPTAQEQLEEINRRLRERRDLPRSTTPSPAAASPVLEMPTSPLGTEFRSYRLGPGDSFFVNVRRFPEANFQATLDLQGNIVMPLAGVINVQGLTLEQAQARIQSELERFFINPDVGLTLVAQRPVTVTVIGEVERPGLYPLPNPQLSTALFSAGGTTRLANLRTVQIRRPIRNQAGEIVDVVAQDIDLFTPLAEAGDIPDIRLSDGDVLVIPTLTAQEIETYDRSLIARSTLAKPTMNIRLLDYTRGLRTVTLPSGSNFLDMIAGSGTDIVNADLRNVAVVRFDPQAGTYVTEEFSARNALRGDLSQNPTLEDEDIVVIGRNLIARISFFFSRIAQPVREPLQLLLLFDTLVDLVDGDN